MKKITVLFAFVGIFAVTSCEEEPVVPGTAAQGVTHTHESDIKDSRGNNIYSVTHTHVGGASRSHDYAYWNHYHAQPTPEFPNYAWSHSHVYDGTPNNPGHPACHNSCLPDTPPTPREATPTPECSGTGSGNEINPPSWMVGFWKTDVTILPEFIEEGHHYFDYWVGWGIKVDWGPEESDRVGNGEIDFVADDGIRDPSTGQLYDEFSFPPSPGAGMGYDSGSRLREDKNTSDEPVDRSDGCIRFYHADAWHTFIKEGENELIWHLSSKVGCGEHDPGMAVNGRSNGNCFFQGGDGEHTVLRLDQPRWGRSAPLPARRSSTAASSRSAGQR